MKVLVTGANGYIGGHVVKQLLDNGNEVVACDIRFDNVDPRATQCNVNIFGDTEGIYERLGKPDVCLHLAWRDGFVHNSKRHMEDLSGHFHFLTSMIEQGLKHVAAMGTMHEVGYWEGAIDENTPCNPMSLYGIAKDSLRRALLLYGKQHECIVQWLRGYYITGDDAKSHSIFGKILAAEQEGKKLFPFTTGKNKYDFSSVQELAEMIAKAVTQTKVTGIINCCSGEPMSLADRVEKFIKDNHLSIRLDYGKFPDRPYDSPVVYGDATKIKEIMGEK